MTPLLPRSIPNPALEKIELARIALLMLVSVGLLPTFTPAPFGPAPPLAR